MATTFSPISVPSPPHYKRTQKTVGTTRFWCACNQCILMNCQLNRLVCTALIFLNIYF